MDVWYMPSKAGSYKWRFKMMVCFAWAPNPGVFAALQALSREVAAARADAARLRRELEDQAANKAAAAAEKERERAAQCELLPSPLPEKFSF